MSIERATIKCLRTMTACLRVEELMKAAWAENRLADFNLWIAGVGALANLRSSLDTRLDTRPEAREVIANLLDLLSGAVDECQRKVNCEDRGIPFKTDDEEDPSNLLGPPSCDIPPRPFSPWSDESGSEELALEASVALPSTKDSLVKSMQDVESILDQLAQIALAVRRSGKRSRLQRADQQFKVEEHLDLQTHLTTIILLENRQDGAEFNALENIVDPINLSDIQLRLIRCNLKRRNRFLYAQQHSKSLQPVILGRGLSSDATTFDTAKTEQRYINTDSKKSDSKAVIQESGSTMNFTVITGTKASAVSDSFALPQPASPLPATSTIVSSTITNLKYPQPPKLVDGAHNFTCPCCCQSLPKTLSEGKRWKNHIAEDLSPYTCVLGDCASPETLYSTKKDWKQHLLAEHQGLEYWICYSCEATEQFHNEEAFIQHTKSRHNSSLGPNQVSILVDICRRFVPMEITSCPLCTWPNDIGGKVDKTLLLDHIARDLHAFSLRSLPWDDDNGQASEQQINQSSEKVFEWLVKNELFERPSIKRSPLERKTYQSNYFRHNSYFGNSSTSSTSISHDSVHSIANELKHIKEMEGSVSFKSLVDEALPRCDGGDDEWPPVTKNPDIGCTKPETGTFPDAQDEPNTPRSLSRKQKMLEMAGRIFSQRTDDAESEMGYLLKTFGKNTLEMLLDQPGDEVTVTSDIIKAVAGNQTNGDKIMSLLINWKGEDILMTSKSVSTIAALFDGKTMGRLLDYRGVYQVIITEEIVKATASNENYGKEVMALLLVGQGDHIIITEGALSIIGMEFDEEIQALIYNKLTDPICIPENIVETVATEGLISEEVALLLKSQELGHHPMEGLSAPVVQSALNNLEIDADASNYKNVGGDWYAIFNQGVQRDIDVDLAHCLVHESIVQCVQFSSDGKYVATSCEGSAQIFDVYTGEKICVIEEDPEFSLDVKTQSICFSPNGRYLACGYQDGLIRVWEIATNSIHNRFSSHEERVSSLSFSNNGHTIASGSIDCTVRLWDIEEYSNPWSFGVNAAVMSVAISPDTRLVAAGLLDHSVRVWNTGTGSLVADLQGPDGHHDHVYSVAFLPNSRFLVSGSLDRTVKLWKLDLPRHPIDSGIDGGRCIRTLAGHYDSVLSVSPTADTTFVISGSMNHSVYFWATESGVAQFMLKAPHGAVTSVSSSPRDGYFATASMDKKAHIWKYRRQIN